MSDMEWVNEARIGDSIKCSGGTLCNAFHLTVGRLYEITEVVTATWSRYPTLKVFNDRDTETWVMLDMFEPQLYRKHPDPTELFF